LKLDAPASPAPAAPISEPAPDAGFDDLGGGEPEPSGEPASDKPFNDEPFDAGVEADEDTDPKKYIEQLTGKLGQSLRKYTETQGQPDFDLEKFAINSLLSASHTAEMDEEDKKDIIKKVNTAGNDGSEDSDMGGSNDNPDNTDNSNDGLGNGDDSNNEFGDDQGEEELEEYTILETKNQVELDNPKLYPDGWKEMDGMMFNPKKNNMFQEGSNDILDEMKPCWSGYKQVGMKEKGGKEVPNCVPVNENKNLINSKKSSIFAKEYIISKLQESFNQEDMTSEPQTAPAPVKTPTVKPGESKPFQPSRKNKPFLPMPEVQPDPKADNEGDIEA
jgi:hypothetical protein